MPTYSSTRAIVVTKPPRTSVCNRSKSLSIACGTSVLVIPVLRFQRCLLLLFSFSRRWLLWPEGRRRRVACCQLRSPIGDEDNEHTSPLGYARIFTDEMFTAWRLEEAFAGLINLSRSSR